MSNQRPLLKIHCLSTPQFATEWDSILGDKYRQALPFDFELTEDLRSAQVIAWDGIVGKKLESLLPAIKEILKGKVLLLTGESPTLMKDTPMVRLFQTGQEERVDLPGWNVLPEDILAALISCFEKIKNV